MLLKLNNRLVDHQVSRNSTFLLIFWKVHGILSLEQLTVLGADRCALIVFDKMKFQVSRFNLIPITY